MDMKATPQNHFAYNRELRPVAHKLRNEMTKAEASLWKYVLKAAQMKGCQFRRQRPVLHYVADFMCKELMLVIEVDGITHAEALAVKKDKVRQEAIESAGFTVVRFLDIDVLNNISGVHQFLENWIEDFKKILPNNYYLELQNKFYLWINNTTIIQNSSEENKIINNNYFINERWFGLGLLSEIGYGNIDNHEFLMLPYGAFFRGYLGKRFAVELQYYRSVFSFTENLVYTSTGEKSGELYSKFKYHDVNALLNVTSIRNKKNRLRAFGGAKVSFRESAEFKMTRTQTNFVGRGELPTLSQYTSIVFGCGYEFGGSGHKLPLIITDLRVDLGTKDIMREFIIAETNTHISFGKILCLGLQVGIGF